MLRIFFNINKILVIIYTTLNINIINASEQIYKNSISLSAIVENESKISQDYIINNSINQAIFKEKQIDKMGSNKGANNKQLKLLNRKRIKRKNVK